MDENEEEQRGEAWGNDETGREKEEKDGYARNEAEPTQISPRIFLEPRGRGIRRRRRRRIAYAVSMRVLCSA